MLGPPPRRLRLIVALWVIIGIGHLLTVDLLTLALGIPFLIDVARDQPVFELLASVRVSFHGLWVTSPKYLASFKAFSLWLGLSSLGIAALTRELSQVPAGLRRLAAIHVVLSGGFLGLAVSGFFIVPILVSAAILATALSLLVESTRWKG